MPIFYFYKKTNGRSLVFDFIFSLDKKIRAKIFLYITILIQNNFMLGTPYVKNIKEKIWEIRVDYDKNFYRVFYFVYKDKKIILLHGFNKKTNKTPEKEIAQAEKNYFDFQNNKSYKTYDNKK